MKTLSQAENLKPSSPPQSKKLKAKLLLVYYFHMYFTRHNNTGYLKLRIFRITFIKINMMYEKSYAKFKALNIKFL